MARKKVSKTTTDVSDVSGSEVGVRRTRSSKVISKKRPKGLTPNKYSKVKQQYFDFDYIDRLSEEDKQWLADFVWEHLGANLQNNKFHKTDELKKLCYDMNNSKQRDIFNHLKISNLLVDMHSNCELIDEKIAERFGNGLNLEEEKMIQMIDEQISPDRELTLEDYISVSKLK